MAKHNEDVFACEPVVHDAFCDLNYTRLSRRRLLTYLQQFRVATKPSEIAFKGAMRTMSDGILFVSTDTPNLDPMTRVGLPHRARQELMREQQMFDLSVQCVEVAFSTALFTAEDVRGHHASLHRMCKLCIRFLWHLLRGNSTARQHAVRFVPTLQAKLEYSLRVASTLTEIFTDNDQLLDSIDDDMVASFIRLIRQPGGRQERFLSFLSQFPHDRWSSSEDCACPKSTVRLPPSGGRSSCTR